MRRAIEKLCFLLLSLAAASLVSFVFLSRLSDLRAPERSALPLLVNPAPRSVESLTRAALARVKEGGADSVAAQAELIRLGGAAFPFVLPALDSLDPSARGRVAGALAPVALRMGVAEPEDVASPERAMAFFARFWQDRGADFRSAAVRRKVARLSERALALRTKEVIELDTFALEELLTALGRIATTADVERAARLTPVLAHVTGQPWEVRPDASIRDAAVVVTRWRDWAIEHAQDYRTLDGPSRLGAMVMQTRYFRWVASLPRAVSGEDEVGAHKLDAALAAARTSLPLAAAALGLGLATAATIARLRDQRGRRWRGLFALALVLASLPVGIAALRAAAFGRVLLFVGIALSVAARASIELGVSAPARSRGRQAFERASVAIPVVLASTLAGEAVLGTGLGALSLRALGGGDLPMLMWIAFALSGSGAASTALLGLVFPARRPRAQPPREFGRAPRRGALIAFAVVLLALLPLAALGAPFGPNSLALVARTLGAVLAALLGTLLVGSVLGLLAGGLSRTADQLLARGVELSVALPQPFLAAACFLLGGLPGAFALGCVRGVELSWVLRNRIHEQREADDDAPASLGRAPLAPYVRRLLPAAIAPFTTTFVLSVPWFFTLEAAAARLGTASANTLASAAAFDDRALLAICALCLALFVLTREFTPRDPIGETPGAPVLSLSRRAGSVFPAAPEAISEVTNEPPEVTDATAAGSDETSADS